MIEEALANYGVLGLWTTSLLWQQWKHARETKKLIQNNTKALAKVYAVISKCQKR